ncbi:hypothetical protein FHX52_0746 [Humibacillus xanthopallidus]|uniref:Uncharacterized protein n=1 Tax=Humibacillus xanthopallidus TaxID=412689 RepID=A0A543PU95_9MICO|nr:hypothetical protein FHX52_0746 [Humibacillus xanthopallidus]
MVMHGWGTNASTSPVTRTPNVGLEALMQDVRRRRR